MDFSSNYNKHICSKGIRKKLIERFNQEFVNIIGCMMQQNDMHKLLDLGCGEGFMLKHISDKFPHITLTGCDICEKAISMAQTQVPSADFLVCDGYSLPFPDKCFDIVVCSEVLEHVQEPSRIVAEISRVIRSSGG